MAAAVGRLFRTSARHVSTIPWGISASAALRPAVSGRMCLTNLLWSGSGQAKSAFSTSSSYQAPAVTQHAPYFKGTAVVKGEFKDLSLDDFKGKYLVLFFYPLDLGLFIIDPNGVIKHLSVNDLPVGRSVEETLRLVKAFQFVESHGEVCPANWTPDSPTEKIETLRQLLFTNEEAPIHVSEDEKVCLVCPAHISGMNVFTSRSLEPIRGIQVMDKEGNVIGHSKRAGRKAVNETAISRTVLFGTSAFIPEVFTYFFKRTQFFLQNPQSVWTMKLSCTFLVMGLVLPVSFSMFPQIGRIQRSKLEEEIQSLTEETELFYNRGV
ncbi:Sideroflexin-4 [Tupaia chinensis]|uniref:Sideroflexin-4 n=1 Tax=Tupaia chinensis TaxID=246437 RepID=L9J9W4_TUPCH|nr:Sideroflexin-4 [Tupaia chinensis]